MTKIKQGGETTTEISVVIPIYNGCEEVTELAHRLETVLESIAKSYEVILVDDGSKDGSWALISELSKKYQWIRALRHSRNFGQHATIFTGLAACRGSFIVVMDGDLEEKPEDIPNFINALKGGSDLAVGICRHGDTPRKLSRSVASRIFHRSFSNFGGGNSAPKGTQVVSMRAFNRKFKDALEQYGEQGIVFGPLTLYIGFQCTFIDVGNRQMRSKRSGYSLQSRLDLAIKVFLRYGNPPIMLPLIIGVGGLVASFATTSWAVIYFLLTGGNPLSLAGWVTVVQLSLGFLILSLTVPLLLIVAEILKESLKRPRAHVSESANL
jgi:dolichol-phosphate mannosyltransferase